MGDYFLFALGYLLGWAIWHYIVNPSSSSTKQERIDKLARDMVPKHVSKSDLDAWVVGPDHLITTEQIEFDTGDMFRAYHSGNQYLTQGKSMEDLFSKIKAHFEDADCPVVIQVLKTEQFVMLHEGSLKLIDNANMETDK